MKILKVYIYYQNFKDDRYIPNIKGDYIKDKIVPCKLGYLSSIESIKNNIKDKYRYIAVTDKDIIPKTVKESPHYGKFPVDMKDWDKPVWEILPVERDLYVFNDWGDYKEFFKNNENQLNKREYNLNMYSFLDELEVNNG